MRKTPWIVEGAVWFLDAWLLQERFRGPKYKAATVLEFGGGASTIWLRHRALEVVTIEHHPEWAAEIGVEPTPRPYWGVADKYPDQHFDLILIDGRDRCKCCQRALPKLRRNGVLCIDNMERMNYQRDLKSLCPELDDWNRCEAHQRREDGEGFSRDPWVTTWWIKP